MLNLSRSRLAAAAAMANDGHQNGRGRQATYSDGSIEREMERRPNDISSGKEYYLHVHSSEIWLVTPWYNGHEDDVLLIVVLIYR